MNTKPQQDRDGKLNGVVIWLPVRYVRVCTYMLQIVLTCQLRVDSWASRWSADIIVQLSCVDAW